MILVAGEALVDLVVRDGSIVPLVGGGPYNTARALGRLGASVGFLGHLSHDHFGRLLSDALVASGVSLGYARPTPEPSPLAIAYPDAHGDMEYRFYLAGTAFAAAAGEELPTLGSDVQALHVGSLALSVEPSASVFEALLEQERTRRVVMVDPNVRPATIAGPSAYRSRFERVCRAAHIVKLSASDAEWFLPGFEPEDVASRLLELGPELVAITLGPEGAIASTPAGSATAGAPHVEVVDTIGAGDAFGAGLLVALEERKALAAGDLATLGSSELEEILRFCTAVAAIACSRAGADTPARAEVEELLARS